MAKKKPKPKGVAARARSDRAFLKKALADPGLRSKLDASQLPAAMRRRRELNIRLNAPITPGSPTTERDLAHAAQAATTVRYGPQESQFNQNLGVAQQTERDTGSYYDQYLQNLQAHQANVAAFQQGAQQAMAGTAAGITGLAGQDFSALQGQANQQAAQQGVAPAGNLLPDANAAAAVRQALMGSFQAQQALQGAAANTFADTQARVVGPGQKLAAQAQAAGRTRDVRKQISDLKTEEGAFNQQFRDTRRQDEFKNVLAQQTLSGNQAIAATNAQTSASNAASNAAARSPEGKAAATTATEEAKNAAKLGISVHQYRVLGPTERQRRLKALKATTKGSASDSRYTSGPFAGMLKSDVNKLSNAQAQAKVDAYQKKKGKPKPGEKGAGPNWQTNAQQGQGASDASNLKDLANRAKSGQPFVAGHAPQRPMNRHEAARKIQQSAKVRDPALLSAALDAAYDRHLSPETVRKLIAAGYKPSRVAQALGVPTRKGYKPPAPKTPGQRAAGQIPGLGSVPR